MVYIKGIYRSYRRRPLPAITLDMHDEFPWGAHKNRTVSWVLAHNPSYIDWFVRKGNSSGIKFTQEVRDQLEVERAKPEFKPELCPHEFYSNYYSPIFKR